ncbi:Glyco-hydro-79C domain-containing protein [Mycena sanguinolenta]|uniref:Glyco-hydro-79C domain-containing protein n=1 Tax=Mycena sanguinolenta TaxID=230812 RepID=A0A8H7DG09_9AGAR|nr:Glyco-hydro-79C domain-containing protein [Mycena sanguinolenta]
MLKSQHTPSRASSPLAATSTSSAASGPYTGVAAYNPGTLVAPPLPTTSVLTQIPVNLQQTGTVGLSIKQKGRFFGFSVEMSVSNQVLGKNSTLLQVPFLNLMSNIVQRAGSVMIRVGGNSQESAELAPAGSLPDGRVIIKNLTGVTGTTQTPPLEYSIDLLYMMRNISSLVNVRWFLGIPWFITDPFDTKIVTAAPEILGDYLLGLQAGNEPDMYNLHGHRGANYSQFDYEGEIGDFISQVGSTNADPTGQALKSLVVPNIANFQWTPEDVWNTGLVETYTNNIAYLAVEKYPRDNCAAMFGGPGATPVDPQSVLPLYLTHDAHTQLLQPFLNSTTWAQTVGKEFLMFETNTASCGGFLGVSDSFTAALWGIDYALQMANSNFSGAMFHLGGQNVFYNPFTSPPTNESTFHQWSVGPLYYAALAMAEAMGPSNNTQVLNYGVTDLTSYTPIYVGRADVHAVINVAGGPNPASVQVKYMAASSVVQKGNWTWAGQTFGGFFESDGRPMGEEDIKTVQCDTTAQTCTIDVPAPGFALVFLNSDAQAVDTAGGSSMTFPTTAVTKTRNTATVDPSVLATSNGFQMSEHELAGTSKPPSAALHSARVSLFGVGVSVVLGAVVALVGRAL